MTNWLWLFLAFYIIVAQPALLGWMLDNCSLYQLAWLNAGIFFIAWIISAMFKSSKNKDQPNSLTSHLLWENVENKTWTGVSVVKVQETTVKEIEVAKVELNKENLPITEEKTENFISQNETEEKKEDVKEEVKEDKVEEKSLERPMREWVSIPKIVQPLSWHQTNKKKKRERKWWQRLVLLLTLAVSTVVAWTLWEFLETRWISIALFLWRILYLVIWKLFDINWFYNAKRLFTNWLYIILILAWIWYGIYAMQQDNKSFLPSDFSEKVTSYVKNWFSMQEDVSEVNSWDIIYVFEWTWEVINNVEDAINILGETWKIEDESNVTEIYSWMEENNEQEMNYQPESTFEEQDISLSDEDAKKQITMWEAVKSLLAWVILSNKTNTTFKYVSKTSELYPYFKTAQEKWMIWTDTDPSKIVSCETYITMKWIWEWWNVGNYSKNEIKTAYRNKAIELWKLNGCKKWAYVTKWNL